MHGAWSHEQAIADALAAGLPTPAERVEIVWAALRRGDDTAEIRARWPSVWPDDPAGQRKFWRDVRAARRTAAASR